MNYLPKARTGGIVVQNLADEILIYDLQTSRACCLNQTAAFVWQNSDGATTVTEIALRLQKKYRAPVEEAVVWFALKTLADQNLLAADFSIPGRFAAVNRRQMIEFLGKSAAIAIPLVFAITAPPAAHAASGALLANGRTCSSGSQCAGGGCSGNVCCTADGQICPSVGSCCSGTCNSQNRCITPASMCVLPHTPITTADGASVRAVDVSVGQKLLGVNCFNGEKIAGRVKAKQDGRADAIYAITAASGDVVLCSPSHPLIKGFGDWEGTPVERFKIGDPLLVHDREANHIVEAKTVHVERIGITQPVILFEMETVEHTFVSGGIVSHNKNAPGDG